jgi:hypothetical protein
MDRLQHPTCAPDADHYEYDTFGELEGEGSLEGSEDGDDY